MRGAGRGCPLSRPLPGSPRIRSLRREGGTLRGARVPGLAGSPWPSSHRRVSPGPPRGSSPLPAPGPFVSCLFSPAAFRGGGGFPAWRPRDPPSALEETAESPGRAPRGGLWPERTPACTPGLAFPFGDGGWAHAAGSGGATAPSRPFGVLFCFFRLLSAPSPLKNKKHLASSLPVTLPLPVAPRSPDLHDHLPPPPRCVASAVPRSALAPSLFPGHLRFLHSSLAIWLSASPSFS